MSSINSCANAASGIAIGSAAMGIAAGAVSVMTGTALAALGVGAFIYMNCPSESSAAPLTEDRVQSLSTPTSESDTPSKEKSARWTVGKVALAGLAAAGIFWIGRAAVIAGFISLTMRLAK